MWESTGTLARVPLEGGAPRELLENVTLADWSPDGRDLAVVHKVGGKQRVEFPIGKVLYETADGIESMRFSPQGDRLAISPYLGDIVCIDLAGKVTGVSKRWGYIGNIAWRPDGGEIWFGGHKGSEKYAVYAVTPSGRGEAEAPNATFPGWTGLLSLTSGTTVVTCSSRSGARAAAGRRPSTCAPWTRPRPCVSAMAGDSLFLPTASGF